MIALKVEKIGDRLAVVLNDDAVAALHLKEGDTVHLEAPNGAAGGDASWMGDPHARGRAFLRRYNKSFSRLEG
jgi:anaerobic selenocysteine-containing dehydrogenase